MCTIPTVRGAGLAVLILFSINFPSHFSSTELDSVAHCATLLWLTRLQWTLLHWEFPVFLKPRKSFDPYSSSLMGSDKFLLTVLHFIHISTRSTKSWYLPFTFLLTSLTQSTTIITMRASPEVGHIQQTAILNFYYLHSAKKDRYKREVQHSDKFGTERAISTVPIERLVHQQLCTVVYVKEIPPPAPVIRQNQNRHISLHEKV